MVQIEEIRAAFVARLKKSLSAHGIDQWGAGARLAEIAKVTPKASSKWLNGESMPGPAKMQAIARALGVKIEWLQHGAGDDPALSQISSTEQPEAHGKQSAADKLREMLAGKTLGSDKLAKLLAVAEGDEVELAGGVLVHDAYRPGKVGDEVWIAHYDIRGALGGGEVAHDYPEMLQDVRVSPSQLRAMGVEFVEHYHLKMITGWGQSMTPTIKHGDPLLVDISIKEFVGDGIYFFSYQGFQYIKRLQMKGKDKFKMISDNRKHKAEDIFIDETYIQARVLLVWNANLV
ncbi:propanediol utilization protein [Pseudomonas lundensis]|jgi:phage repressor protein C with HTH and peptisase S24 domain|uniref:Helix-turn-helix domain-containing protein n=3 Tax=Pseudomonas TaxID=286 RepID=A0A9Q5B328_PSEFR|nr:propanediol utilization protein [Pseudomonas lundensis]MBM1196735.1 helix-turn-helix domain-containing protein [Pseudomonas weihenstephanensis]NNB33766.1 helix-turn-helix domain-containing protein [Pseudomonas fragi]HCS07684.1 helix-turn-helix domain-containing protein [Pseudomonas sp.]MBM1184131.1 helix-turn-helix domain-containing protein [Pseudomonas lundensis]